MVLWWFKIWRYLRGVENGNYRETFFKAFTGNKNNITILGKCTWINPNITVGKNVVIYPDTMFWGDGEIRIGDDVNIGNGTIIYASKTGGVEIGDNTVIAAQTYIIDCDHGFKEQTLIRKQANSVKKITIGNDVWLAANCTILKGSKSGDGSIIGAKSLVKGEIPENVVAVGIPAKTIKGRYE